MTLRKSSVCRKYGRNACGSQGGQTERKEVKPRGSCSRGLQGALLSRRSFRISHPEARGSHFCAPDWPVTRFREFFQPRAVPQGRLCCEQASLLAAERIAPWFWKKYPEGTTRIHCGRRGLDPIQESPSNGADPGKELGRKQEEGGETTVSSLTFLTVFSYWTQMFSVIWHFP